MEFTLEQRKIIYNAFRYYQMNRVPHAGKDYSVCDDILDKLFSEVIGSSLQKSSNNRLGGDLDAL